MRNFLEYFSVCNTLMLIDGVKLPFSDLIVLNFSEQGHLKRHLLLHQKEKPYICEECNESFAKQNQLKRHMTVHTGQKPYSCTEPGCTKSFNYPGQLSAHIKSAHKSEQVLKGKYRLFTRHTFRNGQKTLFFVHDQHRVSLTHTLAEKKHVCGYENCGESFVARSELTKHVKERHPPFCFICNKEFATRSVLKGKLHCLALKRVVTHST